MWIFPATIGILQKHMNRVEEGGNPLSNYRMYNPVVNCFTFSLKQLKEISRAFRRYDCLISKTTLYVSDNE